MQIAPVDYMPISKIPSDTTNKDQKGSLYLDAEQFKKIKKESSCAGCFSMTTFRLCGYRPVVNYVRFIPVNFSKSYAFLNYDDHSADRGFKTLVGWIVDTLA